MMARYEAATIGNAEVSGFATSADALLELGLMYSLGRDVDVDLVEAHKWFNLAALRGSQRARQYRTDLTSEMTRRQVSQAQRMARRWLAGSKVH